jgi:hypothetical protein
MNNYPFEPRRPVAIRENSSARPSEGVPARIGVHTVANDDELRATREDGANPLVIVTIAMTIFFGLAAVILALA